MFKIGKGNNQDQTRKIQKQQSKQRKQAIKQKEVNRWLSWSK